MKKDLFVMLRITVIAFVATTTHAAVLTGPIINPANNNLYYLLDTATWSDSELEAQALGGHLVTIDDQAENDWVYDTFVTLIPETPPTASLWIGLNDEAQEGNFVWTSGEPVNFVNWYGSQPDNWLGAEHYVQMITPHSTSDPLLYGKWNDTTVDAGTVSSYGVVEVVVPLPPAAWLLGSAMIAVVAMMRKKAG